MRCFRRQKLFLKKKKALILSPLISTAIYRIDQGQIQDFLVRGGLKWLALGWRDSHGDVRM